MTIKESQSVITWDFDVMKGDVQYTVFRHKRPREAVSSTSLSSFGSDVSLNQSGVIAGVDAVVVEKPRHCFDGESIQVYNTDDKWDIPRNTMRERWITILYHAIDNTVANKLV